MNKDKQIESLIKIIDRDFLHLERVVQNKILAKLEELSKRISKHRTIEFSDGMGFTTLKICDKRKKWPCIFSISSSVYGFNSDCSEKHARFLPEIEQIYNLIEQIDENYENKVSLGVFEVRGKLDRK